MKKKSTVNVVKRFLPYYKPYLNVFICDMLCSVIVAGVELAFPIIVRSIMQDALTSEANLIMPMILQLCGLYVFLKICDVGANYYINYCGHYMGARMEKDMRRDLFSHYQTLDTAYYDNTKIGQLMSRITNDLFEVTELSHHGPENIFLSFLQIVGSFIILSSINFWLTLVIFVMIPFMLWFTVKLNKKMKETFAKNREKIAIINEQLEDSIAGIRVVKSFANEDIEIDKFRYNNEAFVKTKKDSYKYMGVFFAGIRTFDSIMYLTVILMGSYLASINIINVADVIAFILYVSTFLNSIRRLVEFTESFQRGVTGFERFLEILDTKPTIVDKEDAIELTNVKGDIKFENVDFSYNDASTNVLTNINLEIKAGGSIAIVGPSGSGKTTICALIPRFYSLSNGAIYIDGKNIEDIKLRSLRNNIGIVQQDVYLFSGTIADNIMYGKPDASREEIIQAAKDANAHEFIMEMPNGYDTYVGERGVKLSGGQKQRISIARVFLKNPPLLILDEATSALDNESEKVVQESIEKLAKGRTTLTIAHRLSTIKNADQIIVLTEKGIEEQGSHDELLALNGIYADLYKLAFN